MALPTRAIRFQFQDHRPAENILKERFAGRVVMPNVGELRQNANRFLEGVEQFQLSSELTNEMKGQLESLQRQLRNAIATKERLQRDASGLTDDTSKEYYATLIKDVDNEMNRLRYEIEKIRLSDEFFKMSKQTDPKEIAETRNVEVLRSIFKETPAMALKGEGFEGKKVEPEISTRQILGDIFSMRNIQDPVKLSERLASALRFSTNRPDANAIEGGVMDFIKTIPDINLRNEVRRNLGMRVPKSRAKKKIAFKSEPESD